MGSNQQVARVRKISGLKEAGVQVGGEKDGVGKTGAERLQEQELIVNVAAEDADGLELSVVLFERQAKGERVRAEREKFRADGEKLQRQKAIAETEKAGVQCNETVTDLTGKKIAEYMTTNLLPKPCCIRNGLSMRLPA